jgi:hypothetical protein
MLFRLLPSTEKPRSVWDPLWDITPRKTILQVIRDTPTCATFRWLNPWNALETRIDAYFTGEEGGTRLTVVEVYPEELGGSSMEIHASRTGFGLILEEMGLALGSGLEREIRREGWVLTSAASVLRWLTSSFDLDSAVGMCFSWPQSRGGVQPGVLGSIRVWDSAIQTEAGFSVCMAVPTPEVISFTLHTPEIDTYFSDATIELEDEMGIAKYTVIHRGIGIGPSWNQHHSWSALLWTQFEAALTLLNPRAAAPGSHSIRVLH